ncbi:MAG TPA: hypothetical protein VG294_07190 [Solirubrobacteraceae bacterium]|jgi:hypothetical protein|nr:hypothetical protein [Solirubrobacteraceae bacterium]
MIGAGAAGVQIAQGDTGTLLDAAGRLQSLGGELDLHGRPASGA